MITVHLTWQDYLDCYTLGYQIEKHKKDRELKDDNINISGRWLIGNLGERACEIAFKVSIIEHSVGAMKNYAHSDIQDWEVGVKSCTSKSDGWLMEPGKEPQVLCIVHDDVIVDILGELSVEDQLKYCIDHNRQGVSKKKKLFPMYLADKIKSLDARSKL